jgi:hypothetical protein
MGARARSCVIVNKEGRQTMIAVRTTWLVKPNCMEKALELLATDPPELGDHAVRIYTPRFSPNLLVFEMTSESIEEHDKWWDEFNAASEAAAIWEQWNALVKQNIGTEVWNVTEFR